MTEELGFGAHLACGLLRWDMLRPFPRQELADQVAGDAVVEQLSSYLTGKVNPAAIETAGSSAEGLLADLGALGLLEMQAEPALGGLGLSAMNAFRVIQATASWTCAGGFALAAQNGIGAGAHLPALADGPLRELISRRMATGMISGSADTEVAGAANRIPGTTATPVENGSAYLLNGDKVFIINAPIAGMLCVSAAIDGPSGKQAQIFVVDTAAPGLSVTSRQEFMGMHGLPNATVRLRDVRVAAESMLTVPEGDWRLSERLRTINALGRIFIVGAPALAIAKLCLHWQRDFVNRRRIDGRALGDYEKVQRIISASLADVLAISSVVEWCLLAKEQDLAFERSAAKNITSLACWRVLERTMSLLAGEGYESARSKAARGAPPLPLERFYRDARVLRIGGGVDFQVDNWSAQSLFERYFFPPLPRTTDIPLDIESAPVDAMNRKHLSFVSAEARSFAATAARLTSTFGEPERLFDNENLMINMNRVVTELLTMSLVVARTCGHPDMQDIADVYCTAARQRIRSYKQKATTGRQPGHAGISRRWLAREAYDALLADVITVTPPVS